MLMDEKMDHGPLLAQAPITLNEWPMSGPILDDVLALAGGEMLTTTIKKLLAGTITPIEQDHSKATYTKKFEKADAELCIDPLNLPAGEAAFTIACKIHAFAGMSDCFFIDNHTRVKIKTATIIDDRLVILRVVPEGKKEMDFSAYLTSR
jgi:methionyl-tRNA formyltransferase